MKTTIHKLFRPPLSRIWIAGAGGAAAGTAYALLTNAHWYVIPVTSGGGMLVQWLELRWAHYRMRLLLKARRRARMAQLKRQA